MGYFRLKYRISSTLTVVGLTGLVMLLLSSQVYPQVQEGSSAGPIQWSLEELRQKIADVEGRIKVALPLETDINASQLGISLEMLTQRRQKLKWILTTYERLISALKKNRSLTEEQIALSTKSRTQPESALDTPPPYNLSFYDELLDQLETVYQQKAAASVAENLAKRKRENMSSRRQEIERQWRELNERLEKDPDTDDVLSRKFERLLTELDKEGLTAAIALEKLQEHNFSLQSTILDLNGQFTQDKIGWVAQHLEFDTADLTRHIEAISKDREDLELKLETLIHRGEKAEASLRLARQRINLEGANQTVPEGYVLEHLTLRDMYYRFFL